MMKGKVRFTALLCLIGSMGIFNLAGAETVDETDAFGFISETDTENGVEEYTPELFEEDWFGAGMVSESSVEGNESTDQNDTNVERIPEEQDLKESENESEVEMNENQENTRIPSLEETGLVEQENRCGETLGWELKDGTLWITGEGPMTEWQKEEDVPWNAEKENIEQVIISDRVTTIGAYAFYNCSHIKTIEMPDKLEHVGSFASFNCSGVATVTIG